MGLITLLIGSWISVFCVNCYAAIDSSKLNAGEINDPEQHCLLDRTKDNTSHKNNCCDEDCDDALTLVSTLNPSDKLQSINKLKLFDYSILHNDESFLIHQATIDIDLPHYQTPERSCFLPLERFCVLLN